VNTLRFGATGKPKHRHAYPTLIEPDGITRGPCACGQPFDPGAARRGRNNRARGGRAELDIARTYGGEKVGPLGLPEDIRGKIYATQVKSHVGLPPRWYKVAPTIRLIQPSTQLYVWVCSNVLGDGWLAYAPDRWYDLLNKIGEGRTPRLVERWKPGQGQRPIDWIIVRRQDEPAEMKVTGHFVAWSGTDWLDRYGKDQ
jgi:hypothetical protein